MGLRIESSGERVSDSALAAAARVARALSPADLAQFADVISDARHNACTRDRWAPFAAKVLAEGLDVSKHSDLYALELAAHLVFGEQMRHRNSATGVQTQAVGSSTSWNADFSGRALERLEFAVRCPECANLVQHSGFERRAIVVALESGLPIRLYCVRCDLHWSASGDVRERLRELLRQTS